MSLKTDDDYIDDPIKEKEAIKEWWKKHKDVFEECRIAFSFKIPEEVLEVLEANKATNDSRKN